jgi:hypothetical protein
VDVERPRPIVNVAFDVARLRRIFFREAVYSGEVGFDGASVSTFVTHDSAHQNGRPVLYDYRDQGQGKFQPVGARLMRAGRVA